LEEGRSDLALNEHGVRNDFEYALDGQDLRAAHVMVCGHKCAVALQLFIPEPQLAAEMRADKDLIHRRIEANPGIALTEGLGILSEELRPFLVLKVSDPVRHTEMA